MSQVVQLGLASPKSPQLTQLAMLHRKCLPNTLTSSRGSATIAGLYDYLLKHHHKIHIAMVGGDAVAGLVVLRSGLPVSALSVLTHRPWSWSSSLIRLGPRSVMFHILELVRLRRSSRQLPPHDYITALYVADSARRSGVASELVAIAQQDATRNGHGLAVDTAIENEAAFRFYQSVGFVEKCRTKRSIMFTWNVA